MLERATVLATLLTGLPSLPAVASEATESASLAVSRPVRIAAQAGLGVLGAVAPIGAGWAIGCYNDTTGWSGGCYVGGGVGLLLSPFGMAAGITGGGALLGGSGHFKWTLVGELLGATAGGALAIAVVVSRSPNELQVPALGFAATLPLLGGLLAYELSSEPAPSPGSDAPPGQVAVPQPWLSLHPERVMAGVLLSF